MTVKTRRTGEKAVIAIATGVVGLALCLFLCLGIDTGPETSAVKQEDRHTLDPNSAPMASSVPAPVKREAVSSDPELSPIDEFPIVAMDDECVDAVMRLPEHSWQSQRIQNIAGETLEETIENFGNLDDTSMAVTSASSGALSGFRIAAFQNIVVTRLARVRRVLAAGQDNREEVVELLRSTFEKALAQYPQAWAEKIEATKAARAEGKLMHYSENPLYAKCTYRALGATYLLAELGDHQSLGLMLKCHDLEKEPRPRRGSSSPVPPGTTLYAMHRLVQSFPEEQLSAEARRIRADYLQLAQCLPPPQEVGAAKSWISRYDESEPRIVIADPQRKMLRGEPTMRIMVYPARFRDGTVISDVYGQMCEEGEILMEQLRRFVKAAYPEDNTN